MTEGTKTKGRATHERNEGSIDPFHDERRTFFEDFVLLILIFNFF
jgi:hypothetical protein